MSSEPLKGRHVHGLLAPPRVSRNDNLYLPESLKLGDGMHVPWYIGHEDFEIDSRTGRPTGKMLELPPRGQVDLIWNPEMLRLEYDGYVWDDKAIDMIESGETPYVSLAANPKWYDSFHGHKVPMGLQFFSVSQVEHPGIPETTLTMEQILERFDRAAWIAGSLFRSDWVVLEGARPEFIEAVSTGTPGAASAPATIAISEPPFVPPEAGDLPDSGKTILSKVYISLRKQGTDQASAAKQAWAAVKNAGWSKSDDGKWTKKEMLAPDGLMQGVDSYPFSAPPRGYATPAQMAEEVKETMAASGHPEMEVASESAKGKSVRESSIGGPNGIAGDGAADQLQSPSIKKFAGQITAPEKNIGAARTTFERNLESKIKDGTATKQDRKTWEALQKVREEEEEEEGGDDHIHAIGQAIPNPSTAVPREEDIRGSPSGDSPIGGANQKSRLASGTHPSEPGSPTAAPEVTSGVSGGLDNPTGEDCYGYTKEVLEQLFGWSTLSKNEQKTIGEILMSGKYPAANSIAERTVRKLRESGVLKERSIAQERESRGATGHDVQPKGQPSISDPYGFGDQYQFSGHVAEMAGLISSWNMKQKAKTALEYLYPTGSGWAFDLPMLRVPKAASRDDIRERSRKFNVALESYSSQQNEVLLEAVSSASANAALGVDELAPAIVYPTQYAGFARDAVYVRPLPQGTNQSRISTITVPAMGALTENVQPTIVDPTLNTVNVVTYLRGALHQTSFRAERQIIGPYLDGLIMADRVGVLYDEDVMVFGTPNLNVSGTLVATGAQGGLEGNIANVPAANKIVAAGSATAPTAWVSDAASIANTAIMSAEAISYVQKLIIIAGYAPENYVLFMHPKPYADLLNDAAIVRYLQIGAATGDARDALVAQGVIPDLFGFEIRRCTTVPQTITGGTGGVPTYHAWAIKKGVTCVMSVSHDIMIETYRDVKQYATFVSVHYDLGTNLAHPNSAVMTGST